jgi:hypothetical protein
MFRLQVPHPVSFAVRKHQQHIQTKDLSSHNLRLTTYEALCIPWKAPCASERGDNVAEELIRKRRVAEMTRMFMSFIQQPVCTVP